VKLDQTIQQHVEKLPPALQGEVLDYVLLLEQKIRPAPSTDEIRRTRLAGALEQLAALNPFTQVDPLVWEREQRTDRQLPGRE
jgi:hypothetical protein